MDIDTYKKTDKEVEKELNKYEDTKFDDLIKQVDVEYNIAWMSQYEKVSQALTRLKLYNNQRKDKDAVGDLTLFTTHQTVPCVLTCLKQLTSLHLVSRAWRNLNGFLQPNPIKPSPF